jgi:predicted short-subunit dehydrogenase-like oxidoreductase (DUF2520 family)
LKFPLSDRYPMQELERHPRHTPPYAEPLTERMAVVGQGRLGRIISAGLNAAGVSASEPLPRRPQLPDVDVVLLCVPDAEITAAAAAVRPGPLVGHCSGATTLDALAPHESFSIHPLMTVTADDTPSALSGAGAAVAASTLRGLRLARGLAEALGMRPFELAEADRATYHAAASLASNFLITLLDAAERLGAEAGLSRELLAPLVSSTVANWLRLGPERALTGPVARGDEETVQRQREAIADRAPELLDLFDVMVDQTRALAGRAGPTAAGGAR